MLADFDRVLADTGPDDVGQVRVDARADLVIPPLTAEDASASARRSRRSWLECCTLWRSRLR